MVRRHKYLKGIIGGGIMLTASLMRMLVSLTRSHRLFDEPEIIAYCSDVTTPGPNAVRIPIQLEEMNTSEVNPEPRTWSCPTNAESLTVAYLGSESSDKFHRLSCRYAQSMRAENRRCFASREAAVSDGYIPCGLCKP
jgi:hypothetical protein